METENIKEPVMHLLPENLQKRLVHILVEHTKAAAQYASLPFVGAEDEKAELKRRIERLRNERDAFADLTEGATKVVDPPARSIAYCQTCHHDYEENELIHLVVIDNNLCCTTCTADLKKRWPDIELKVRYHDDEA